jgi:predicted metal-dependent phosphotriesterase family hydrolase
MPDADNLVMTVKGFLKNDKIGFCQSHEHLFLSKGRPWELNRDLLLDDPLKTAAELELYKKAGGATVVDCQPVGCGRMAEELRTVSELTGVNIIASTGFHKLVFYHSGHWIRSLGESGLEALFTEEISEGMYTDGDNEYPNRRTGIRPGVIKTAADSDGLTAEYRSLFRAAAAASLKTGVPIICHTEMGAYALEIADFLLSLGLAPQSVILCHLDRHAGDFGQKLEVAKTGVFLELDTIGRFKYHSDEDEVELIEALTKGGFENQILLGLDTTRVRMKSYGGGMGLDYIITSFLPRMRQAGFSETVLNKFMFGNPKRAFTVRY